MLELKLALREIFNSRRFSFFFILNLTLGLAGFIALLAFQDSLKNHLRRESRSILGADLNVYARRPLTSDEDKKLNNILNPIHAQRAEVVELYTMVYGPNGASRLVQVRAIEPGFPYYGSWVSENRDAIFHEPLLWIYPEILAQLGVQLGDSIRIGQQDFRIQQVIDQDPGSTPLGVSLAPRIYLGLNFLTQTQLLFPGSSAFYNHLIQIPGTLKAQDLARQINAVLTDPGIRVETHEQSGEGLGRLSSMVGDYLGLASGVALALALLGVGFALRNYLLDHQREMAVLRSLGARPAFTRRLYLLQMVLLGVLALVPTLLLVNMLLPALQWMNRKFIHLQFETSLNPRIILIALLMSVWASLLISLPILSRFLKSKPTALFSEVSYFETPRFSLASSLWFFPGIVFFWALSVWTAHSFRVGDYFCAGFLIAAAILFALGYAVLKLLHFLDGRKIFSVLILRLGFRNLYRNPVATLSCFLALALGTLLLNLIPQIKGTLNLEFERPDQSKLPSLFLFDIQSEQVRDLEGLLLQNQLQLNEISPLIRARLETVNGKAFLKPLSKDSFTREEETEMRFRNRGFNLTYRAGMSESESLVAGQPFTGISGDAAQISVEQRFAKRLGLHLHDNLVFDVQGVQVHGKIVNLRKVRWLSFQPNFFIVFQPGFLEEAPKTFLASLASLNETRKNRLQTQLVKQFPNISLVDVSRVVQASLNLITQMSWAMTFMAGLSILSGLGVLFSIINLQVQSRRQEIALLKILGARFADVRNLFLFEAGSLALAAAGLGALLSLAVSFLLARVLFEGLIVLDWQIPLASVLGVVGLALLVSFGSSYRVLTGRVAY